MSDKREAQLLEKGMRQENERFLYPLLIGLASYAVLSIFVACFLLFKPVQYRYINTHCDGRIFQNIPVDVAGTSGYGNHFNVENWVSHALERSLMVNSLNYPKDFVRDKSEFFTDEGWRNFLGVLRDSGVMDQLDNHQMVLVPHLIQSPIDVREGVFTNGHYGWVKTVGLSIDFAGENVNQIVLHLEVIIIRTDMNTDPSGLKIAQIKIIPS